MISTWTVSTCYNCNMLMEQNKQLCLELEEAREKQDDSILLAQFACAAFTHLPYSTYSSWQEGAKSCFDAAKNMLDEYKKRVKGE